MVGAIDSWNVPAVVISICRYRCSRVVNGNEYRQPRSLSDARVFVDFDDYGVARTRLCCRVLPLLRSAVATPVSLPVFYHRHQLLNIAIETRQQRRR
jgi:hypothetical protein